MAKKNTKELIKKPDIVVMAFETSYLFVKNNLRFFVIGLIAFLAATFAVYGYAEYASRQEEKAQAALFEGVRSFEDYAQTGKPESLTKAEAVFQKLVQEKRGKAYQVARLYLATIYSGQGKTEEAKGLYKDVKRDSSGTILAGLADQALQRLEQK
jgi:predicted negative regulator of RcsB-dependent stress response